MGKEQAMLAATAFSSAEVVACAIERAARMAHEINRAYCMAIGDMSQPGWEDAPQWQKESALAGVRAHIESKFTMTPEQSHQSWIMQKVADGWTYGPAKDVEKKEHPCMMHYSELPIEQRVKDYLFRAAVHTMFQV